MKGLNYVPENGGNIDKRLRNLEYAVDCVPYASGVFTVQGLALTDATASTLAFTAGENDRVTVDATAGSTKILAAGFYKVDVSGFIQFITDSVAATGQLDVLVNGTSVLTTGDGAAATTAGAVVPVSGTIILDLEVNDVITFTITLTGDDGDTSATLGNASFSLFRIKAG